MLSHAPNPHTHTHAVATCSSSALPRAPRAPLPLRLLPLLRTKVACRSVLPLPSPSAPSSPFCLLPPAPAPALPMSSLLPPASPLPCSAQRCEPWRDSVFCSRCCWCGLRFCCRAFATYNESQFTPCPLPDSKDGVSNHATWCCLCGRQPHYHSVAPRIPCHDVTVLALLVTVLGC